MPLNHSRPPPHPDPGRSPGSLPWLRPTSGGIRLRVVVQPRAGRSETVGVLGDRLKVRIKAPPVDGKANVELVRFLSRALGVPRGSVSIMTGQTGRRKVVAVSGITPEAACAALI